ncbi:transposase [Streptomyces sp. MI02-7b]|uniref:transposase n=1 Tax=Streptomyces sp. MI02-7b TaxID=462941 RepID=UPI0029CA50FA|nr:transposase [Streptomyces sp. MI02-7b]
MPLTDVQWARIGPLLPDRAPKRGGRWRDHRAVIDAIAFTFQTGTQRVHLPEKCGNWRAVYDRLRRWAVDGSWERVLTALAAQADADEDLATGQLGVVQPGTVALAAQPLRQRLERLIARGNG